MLKAAKKILIVSVLISTTLGALADRGNGKRVKNKVMLNIPSSNTSLKNFLAFNLKNGLRYTGSLISSQSFTRNYTNNNTTLLTYQKGNTVYIIPYKQKVVTPEISRGYTGMKLIIKSH
jgi:hypothetical protein